MKLSIFFFLALAPIYQYGKEISNAKEITKELLFDHYFTDHVKIFDSVFSTLPIDGFLEFGLGYSTKFFLDHARHVISVEFITTAFGPDWLNDCLKLYKNYPNWHPCAFESNEAGSYVPDSRLSIYRGSSKIYYAGAHAGTIKIRKNFPSQDYLAEVDHLVSQVLFDFQIKYESQCDIAFVDCGILIRGEFVQALFNRVPIIAAHDIASKLDSYDASKDDYGYSTIQAPPNYEAFYFGKPLCQCGVVFWINKEDPRSEILIPVLRALPQEQ